MAARNGAALTLFAALAAAAAAPDSPREAQQELPRAWTIDPGRSVLSFSIRHLAGRATGTFRDWGGTVWLEPGELQGGAVNVSIRTSSIDTGNDRRDADLRGPRFFASAEHPQAFFQSTTVSIDGTRLAVSGNLSIRGRVRRVVLRGEYLGVTHDAAGHEHIRFDVGTTINRHDFGVSGRAPLDLIGIVLGDEVDIRIVVDAVAQPDL